jgi:S1-C subfamily serine protease
VTDIRTIQLDANGTAPPLDSLDSVVRITFERTINGVTLKREGTAFMIVPWKRALVTSAHVLELDDDEEPRRITVFARTASGEEVEFDAVSAAYPRDFLDSDIGVIRVAGEMKSNDKFEASKVQDADSLKVMGFPVGENQVKKVDVETSYEPPWIKYDGHATDHGMSGGPVINEAGQVVGVHAGRVEVAGELRDAAYNMDGALLTECVNAAFGVV